MLSSYEIEAGKRSRIEVKPEDVFFDIISGFKERKRGRMIVLREQPCTVRRMPLFFVT